MTRPENPELVNKIQQIVIDLVREKGIEGVKMRDVARLAEITPTTIYYYFENKDALFTAIKLSAFAELDEYIEGKVNTEQTFSEQLTEYVRAFVEWLVQYPNLSDLIFSVLPPQLSLDEECLQRYYASYHRAQRIFEGGQKAGEFVAKDIDAELNYAFATMYGLAKLRKEKRLHPTYWDSIDPLVEILIDTVLSRNTTRKE